MSAEGERKDYFEALNDLKEVNKLADLFSEATKLAAIAAAKTVGRGDKITSDRAAVDALRPYLNDQEIDAIVAGCEGKKDKAPMLGEGERLGKGGRKLSMVVDPLEGTSAAADFKDWASSVLAVSERGGLLMLPKDVFYMNKLIVGPEAKGKVDIDAPVRANLEAIAKSLKRDVTDLNIVVLKRERNQTLIEEIWKAGARVRQIEYGDLVRGVLTCMQGAEIHAVMGIGGAPEAVLTAAAVKGMNGEIQAKIWAENEEKEKIFEAEGIKTHKVYTQNDLVPGKFVIFSATAVTDNGRKLRGVRFFGDGARTNTLLVTSANGRTNVEFRDPVLSLDNQNFHYRSD